MNVSRCAVRLSVMSVFGLGVMLGANAALKVTTGKFSDSGAFSPVDNNVLSGHSATSKPARSAESASSDTVLTDGVVGVLPKTTYCYTYNGGTFEYSLGSSPYGYDVKAINLFGGWEGGGWRGHIHLNSVKYQTAALPGVWQAISGTSVQASPGNPDVYCYVKIYDDGGANFLEGVTKVQINLGYCNSGYHALNEIEVSATESPTPEYLETSGHSVSNQLTGSTAFVNTTTLGIAGAPTVDGADEVAFDTVIDKTRFGQLTWTATAPAEVTFPTPAGDDADLKGYLWYRNSQDDTWVPRYSPSQTIRYTKTCPALSVKTSVDLTVFEGDTTTLSWGSVDTGTTGGVSSGEGLGSLDIPIASRSFEIVSGPEGGYVQGEGGAWILSKEGQYKVFYSVMNAAGNVSTADITVNLEEVPLGTITWNGVADSNWNNPANWTPAVVPRDNDEVELGAGAQVVMAAGTYPATGALKRFVVAAGATVVCQGDTTVSPGFGVTINAKEMTVAGAITADGQGYAQAKGPGYTSRGSQHAGGVNVKTYALPPTTGSRIDSDNYPGSHLVYGDFKEPTALGSGGASGAGGGAVRLVVENALALTGSVTANGAGSATGGSVWISAGALSGAGTVSANAGQSGTYGASGGRVAIYHTSSTFTGTVTAKGYHGSSCWGLAGTLYEPGRYPVGTAAQPADVTLSDEAFYVFPENGPTNYWNLTVASGARVGLAGGKLSLGDLSLSGSGTVLAFGQWYTKGAPSMEALELDSITLTSGANLLLPDSTNVWRYDLTSLSIASGTTLYVGRGDWTYANESSGGTAQNPHGRGTEIYCSGNATVAGTLSAQGRGFTEGKGIDAGTAYGPGHGGANLNNGGIYGQPTRPTSLGTGNWNASGEKYVGGGAVKLMVAGTLTLSGRVTADPGYTGSSAQCCASAGSVWIQANRLEGAGTVSAQTTSGRRYGAAGRIAIEAVENAFTGAMTCGMIGYQADNKSMPGTIFTNAVPTVSAFGWESGKVALSSSYAKSGVNTSLMTMTGPSQNSLVFSRAVGQWSTAGGAKLGWTENCYLRNTPGTTVANTVTYTISGLVPGGRYLFSQDGAVIAGENPKLVADENGRVTVSATLAAGGSSFAFKGRPGGTVVLFH